MPRMSTCGCYLSRAALIKLLALLLASRFGPRTIPSTPAVANLGRWEDCIDMHALSDLEHPVLPRTARDVRSGDLADERMTSRADIHAGNLPKEQVFDGLLLLCGAALGFP